MNSRPHSESPRWYWIASIWFGFALVDAMDTVLVMRGEGMHHAWTKLFVTTMLSWLPWALSTPLVLRLGRRFPPVRLRPVTTWVAHLGACAAIGLIFSAWTMWLNVLLNPYAYTSAPGPFAHLWFDKFFRWHAILDDVGQRKFITVGFLGFVLMIPLAITSTRGMIRRLGKRWTAIHRLIYVSATAGVIHYYWLVKADHRLPLIYAAILAALLAYRIGKWARPKLLAGRVAAAPRNA